MVLSHPASTETYGMNTNRVGWTLPVVLCCCTVLCGSVAAAAPPTEPHLVFQKSVIVKDYRDGRVYLAPHRVRRGEHLWKILREHYNMDNRSIAFYCRIARTMNPDINDIDLLEPTQRILLPYRFVAGNTDNGTDAGTDADADNGTERDANEATLLSADVTHVIARDEHLGQVLRERFHLPDQVIFSSRTLALLKDANPHISDFNRLEIGQRIVLPTELVTAARPDTGAPRTSPAPVATDGRVQRVTAVVGTLTRALGGGDNQTGTRDVGSAEGGAVLLDQNRHPVYSFPWQRDVVLDYGRQMPPALRDVIARNWKSAEIVSVREKDDMAAVLDKVLQASGACKVERQAHYIANQGGVQIRVSGDWIVFTDKLLKNVFVVNLVDDRHRQISPALQRYLESLGLDIVNLQTGSTPASDAPLQPEAAAARATARTAAEVVQLTDAILDVLGIECMRDYNTQIFQNLYSGVSLEVLADRMFRSGDARCIIDFHGLPESIIAIIRQQGFRVLQVDRTGQDLHTVARRVIEFCGITPQSSPASFGNADRSATRLRLTVPGLVFPGPRGDVLITGVELDQALIDFLAAQNVHLITY